LIFGVRLVTGLGIGLRGTGRATVATGAWIVRGGADNSGALGLSPFFSAAKTWNMSWEKIPSSSSEGAASLICKTWVSSASSIRLVETLHESRCGGESRATTGSQDGNRGVHESKDVKGHLFGGESAKSKRFDLLRDHVGLVHEARTTGPTKGRFSRTHSAVTVNLPYNSAYEEKIFTPTFGRPTIEERFEGDLSF